MKQLLQLAFVAPGGAVLRILMVVTVAILVVVVVVVHRSGNSSFVQVTSLPRYEHPLTDWLEEERAQ